MNIERFSLYTIWWWAHGYYSGKYYPVTPAEIIVKNAPDVWKRFALPPLLPVIAGWDNPWIGHNMKPVVEYTPELFRKHLEDAKRYIDLTGSRDIVINTWNEWGEGEILGPNAEIGFMLLEQIPRVFAPNHEVRQPIVPDDIKMQVPEATNTWKYVYKPVIDN